LNPNSNPVILVVSTSHWAQFIFGIGASPIHTLGVAFLDENVSQRASPAYLGI
jgi:hypothetical protein